MARKIRRTIDLSNIPANVQEVILIVLRESKDQSDYLLFMGKHVGGMTLSELGERFSLSNERIRQRLEGIHQRIREKYDELYGNMPITDEAGRCPDMLDPKDTSTNGE